jgi:hypothetical protein
MNSYLHSDLPAAGLTNEVVKSILAYVLAFDARPGEIGLKEEATLGRNETDLLYLSPFAGLGGRP